MSPPKVRLLLKLRSEVLSLERRPLLRMTVLAPKPALPASCRVPALSVRVPEKLLLKSV